MPQYLKEHGEQLVDQSYPVVPLPPGSKGPTRKGWQHFKADRALVRQWYSNGSAGDGIGILAAHVPAIDVDILDETAAEEMNQILESLFGPDLLARVGRAPKFLVPFRTDQPFRKLSSGRYTDGVNDHRVEILGAGQQWVAFHVHPETGKPYYWGGGRSILDVSYRDLPVLDQERAAQVIEAFEKLAARRVASGEWQVKTTAPRVVESQSDDPFAAYAEPVKDLTRAQIEWLVHKCDPTDYDRWIDVGMMLHHQYAGSAEGFEIWDAWSANSHKYDAVAMEPHWDSFGKPAGAPQTIRALVGEHGQPPSAPRPAPAGATEEDPYPFSPGDEYMAGFENVRTLVEDLLPDQGVAMVYGASLTGKTFWMLDVAFAIQNGVKWRDKDVQRGSVFYIAAEAGRGIRKRIAAYKALHPEMTAPFFADTAPDLSNLEWLDKIVKSVQLRGGAALVIIDTMSASFQGDDSSQQETAVMIQNCTSMARALGCVVAFVHHSKKDNASYRGSGVLFNDVDTVVEVTADGEGEQRTHCAVVTKQKDDEMGQRYGFRLQRSEPLGFKANGKPITSCTIEHVDAAPKAKPQKAMNDSVAFLKETYDAIAPLDDGVTVVELLEAAKEKYGESNGAGFRGGNYRRALARWVSYEGVRLPDEYVVRM